MKKFFLFLSLVISQLVCFAQKSEIKDFFENYVSEINNLAVTKDVNKVTAYLSPDFQVNRTFIGPNGRVERTVLSVNAYVKGLLAYVGERDIQPNIKIEEISKVIEGPTVATISAVLSMNMKVDGELAEQGGFVVNYGIAKNDQGEWKMVHSDVVRTLIQRNIGNCPTRFYERETALVAELYYPAGFEYKSELEAFNFKTIDKQRFISNDFRQYNWDSDGSLYQMENEKKTKLGVATNEKEAAKLILGDTYRLHCLGFGRF